MVNLTVKAKDKEKWPILRHMKGINVKRLRKIQEPQSMLIPVIGLTPYFSQNYLYA